MHRTWIQRLVGFAWVCLCMLMAGTGGPAMADPPARAGRIVNVDGVAWAFDGDHKEWERLLRNQTLAEGDRVRVDPKSRVSMRIGSSSLWLDEGADMEVMRLDDSGVVLRLEKGALGLALRTTEALSEYRVQTREGELFPDEVGLYRIDQLSRGTRAQSLHGRLRFESDRSGAMQRAWLRDGEQAEFWWAEGPRTEHQALLRDSFANWLQTQANAPSTTGTISQEYVSSEMTGVEELDRNGQWERAPEYGNVWIPTQVAPGWEPYRDGRWVWTRNWGWSWVDDMPWGFAPFHYGRWVVWRGRWCWTPGHYVARPVYAPALVTWRQSPSISIGVTLRQPPPRGTWTPLPPREVYVPTFRHSEDYRNRINRPYDSHRGVERSRDPVGPQRETPIEAPREYPRGNPHDNPRNAEQNVKPWNDGPRRAESGSPAPGAATPGVPTSVVDPPLASQPVAPVRQEPASYSYDPVRGRDRDWERGSHTERRRESPPATSAGQPAAVPILPAMRPPAPAAQPVQPVVAPPPAQRPSQQPVSSEGNDKDQPRKRHGRDKNGSDMER